MQYSQCSSSVSGSLTLDVDEKLLGLHLKVLLSARSDLAHPFAGVAQFQIGYSYCAVIVGIAASPSNPWERIQSPLFSRFIDILIEQLTLFFLE